MKLYELRIQYEEALDAAVDANGEIAEGRLAELLDAVEAKLETRALDIAAYVTELDAEAEAVEKRGNELRARAKALWNRSDSLRRYLGENLAVGTKLKDDRVALSVVPGKPSVVVDDAEKLPPDLRRVTIEPRRKEISELLASGVRIEGCSLVTGRPSVRVR